MTYDRFIGSYITSIKQQIETLKTDLARAVVGSMYQVGQLQGRIAGLEESLQLLENAYEEQDN